MILKGCFGGTVITIVNVYGPNTDKSILYTTLGSVKCAPTWNHPLGGEGPSILINRYGKQLAKVLREGMEDWDIHLHNAHGPGSTTGW